MYYAYYGTWLGAYSWSITCSDLEDSYPDLADQSKMEGSLDVESFYYPSSGSNMNAEVPGTSFNYRCSTGHALADESNPDQILSCRGNRMVDGLDNLQKCFGKNCGMRKCIMNLSYFLEFFEAP